LPTSVLVASARTSAGLSAPPSRSHRAASERSATGRGYPRFIVEEFNKYERCGIFAYGEVLIRWVRWVSPWRHLDLGWLCVEYRIASHRTACSHGRCNELRRGSKQDRHVWWLR
jgi:hypothetical protein